MAVLFTSMYCPRECQAASLSQGKLEWAMRQLSAGRWIRFIACGCEPQDCLSIVLEPVLDPGAPHNDTLRWWLAGQVTFITFRDELAHYFAEGHAWELVDP